MNTTELQEKILIIMYRIMYRIMFKLCEFQGEKVYKSNIQNIPTYMELLDL